ncbi:uncharacterized protein LOC129318140 isoform X1 [Prosopis cineraria]|uniref:uncharacterized protein LOC129318140 isoform X1 n=1 Tax=Prosopis cineraria TaxID=364024 RepID=UPI0024100688|nr:uncharacterized protein LOC129318140 isoform X1 [Prosopis cineraria]
MLFLSRPTIRISIVGLTDDVGVKNRHRSAQMRGGQVGDPVASCWDGRFLQRPGTVSALRFWIAMDSSSLKMASSKLIPYVSAPVCPRKPMSFGFNFKQNVFGGKTRATSLNGSVFSFTSHRSVSSLREGDNRSRINLESLFCYDKAIPEERIEKPIGLSLDEKEIGSNLRCSDCQAKGAVLCTTCSGSGLYVDSILESQGIIVKVRCLGCGGTGNMMCTACGGRGHCGPK